jgi:hypothetical protein
MTQLLGWLSGAPSAANNTGSYYTNAANDIYNLYGPSATSTFTKEQNRALQNQFQTQDQQMVDSLAAKGLAGSGAGQYNFGNLGAQQSGVIAGADAPLFSQGLAGAAGVYSQMPSAQANSYQDAINNFYQAISAAGSMAAGMPPTGLTGSQPPASLNFSGGMPTPEQIGTGPGPNSNDYYGSQPAPPSPY